MARNKLSGSIVYKGFFKNLESRFGKETACEIWQNANSRLAQLEKAYPNIDGDSKMMILPAAALYFSMDNLSPNEAFELLRDYGEQFGKKLSGIIHGITCIPGVPLLLWNNMPKLMREMSSEKNGYTRRIVSENDKLVAVDILSCPLHEAAKAIGCEKIARVVCAMDKAYMGGFKHIDYTRTKSVAEGELCCDYRLSFNKNKK